MSAPVADADFSDPAGEEIADNERPDLVEDTGDFQGPENAEAGFANPLATGPPTFMSSANGRMCALMFNPWGDQI